MLSCALGGIIVLAIDAPVPYVKADYPSLPDMSVFGSNSAGPYSSSSLSSSDISSLELGFDFGVFGLLPDLLFPLSSAYSSRIDMSTIFLLFLDVFSLAGWVYLFSLFVPALSDSRTFVSVFLRSLLVLFSGARVDSSLVILFFGTDVYLSKSATEMLGSSSFTSDRMSKFGFLSVNLLSFN